MKTGKLAFLTLALAAAGVVPAAAEPLRAKPPTQATAAPFEIVEAEVKTERNWLLFRMRVAGRIGESRPQATGKVGGAGVFAYVWPTKLDPAAAGFAAGSGLLAFAVTAHPDFDDTPLYDENADGDRDNDGGRWHSHWVVLAPDDACGPGALKVADIPAGAKPALPATWPGLPILLDSPGYSPRLRGDTISVRVPLRDLGAAKGVAYDAVTAGLRVNADLHAPFLCVTDVFGIASGDLSLPGRMR